MGFVCRYRQPRISPAYPGYGMDEDGSLPPCAWGFDIADIAWGYPHPPQKTLNHPNCWNQIVSENHWSFSLQHNQTIHKTSHLVTSCYIFQISSNSNGQRGPVFHCQASSINYVFFPQELDGLFHGKTWKTKMDDISRATTKIKEASLLSYLQYEYVIIERRVNDLPNFANCCLTSSILSSFLYLDTLSTAS